MTSDKMKSLFILSLVTVSFVPERDHRIDFGRPPRRDVTSGECGKT